MSDLVENPLLLSAKDAAALLGISPALIFSPSILPGGCRYRSGSDVGCFVADGSWTSGSKLGSASGAVDCDKAGGLDDKC